MDLAHAILSNEKTSSTCSIANFSLLSDARATCPASSILRASCSSTSRLIGTVHAIPLLSRPVWTMRLKSCSPTNPSRGLKIPSAMFSTSFRSSLLTCNVYMPSIFFLSERTNLFMSLLPWGDGMDPATLYITLLLLLLVSFFRWVKVEAAFFLRSAFPPPSPCTWVFSRLYCPCAWFAANAWKAYVMKLIVWDVIFLNVVPYHVRCPVCKWIDLHYSSMGAIYLNLFSRCPCYDLVAAKPSYPAIKTRECAIEWVHLSYFAAQLAIFYTFIH